jgi:hypothetical protein
MAAKTIETNNPFALIQPYGKASPWNGLKGQRENGFLVFDTVENGLRAGFINLYNTYLKRGRNTIASIIPVYAPDGGEPYIKFLERYTGFNRNKVIQSQGEVLKLAQGIVHFEAGKNWISPAKIASAQVVALEYLGLESKVKKAAIGGGFVIVGIVAYFAYKFFTR